MNKFQGKKDKINATKKKDIQAVLLFFDYLLLIFQKYNSFTLFEHKGLRSTTMLRRTQCYWKGPLGMLLNSENTLYTSVRCMVLVPTCWCDWSPGESDSDSHWAYCSQFVLCSLHRLADTMERLDVRAFPSEEDYRGVQNTITLLRKKAEMVFSSHMQNGYSLQTNRLKLIIAFPHK